MAYDVDAHKHEHQVKVRLDDQDFARLKNAARNLKFQHSVLSRVTVKWVVRYYEQHGCLPPELEKDIENCLEQKRA